MTEQASLKARMTAGETVIGQTDVFVPDPECRGLYRRRADLRLARAG